jgi:hypothetical protein
MSKITGQNDFGIPPRHMLRCREAAARGNETAQAAIDVAEMTFNRGVASSLHESGDRWKAVPLLDQPIRKRGEG